MALKIYLQRNLRRTILRGHPWVYREALRNAAATTAALSTCRARLCQVFDHQDQALAWALYDPHGPLTLRILSLDLQPPNAKVFAQRVTQAFSRRAAIRAEANTAYRLLNGEADLMPGLVCDIYGDVAVIQCDGRGPDEFWNRTEVASWIRAATDCAFVVEKKRDAGDSGERLHLLSGEQLPPTPVVVQENTASFEVDIEHGQKTGFFLDQRDNRVYVRRIAGQKSVLNLFSYTGGFSVFAGLGGATEVTSVDIAPAACAGATRNWIANALPPRAHTTVCVDVFEFLKSTRTKWDMVLVDPPSMCHAAEQKAGAVKKYVELFAGAAQLVKTGGDLILSSCSSHINFVDFENIISEALSAARRRGRVFRLSGQGEDHPFLQACYEMRYLKFVHLQLLD